MADFQIKKSKKKGFIKKTQGCLEKNSSIWPKNSALRSQVTQFDSKNSLNKQAWFKLEWGKHSLLYPQGWSLFYEFVLRLRL